MRTERIRPVSRIRRTKDVSASEPLNPAEPPKLLSYQPNDSVRAGAAHAAEEAPHQRRQSFSPTPDKMPRPDPGAAFSAQLLAGAPRRGLKGGQELLDTARSTYLGTEWSGRFDRRARAGSLTRDKF